MGRSSTITREDREAIAAAVARAEGETSGEIVTILAESSDRYNDVALVWSALVAGLALSALAIAPDFYLGLFERLTGQWIADWTDREVLSLALGFATLKFLGMYIIMLWQPLRLWLVPRALRHARVRARAIACFRIGAERRTTGRTGILIYLSLAEHRAEIVADEAIVATVAPEIWGDAMAAMIAELKAGRIAGGMIAAVERVGEVLGQHLPRADDDRNELPDRLIEV